MNLLPKFGQLKDGLMSSFEGCRFRGDQSMDVRYAVQIVALCLLSLVQLLTMSSQTMAADALFDQPRITAAINETDLVRIPNNV